MFHRLKKMRKISRLKKVADWQHIDITDPELIDKLTDAMTYGYAVQIDYEGSGWRDIQPYGWNMSKDNNALLMVYKDTGEVRSYRLDRINDVYIDEDSQIATNNNDQMTEDEQMQIYEDLMNEQESFDLPELPDEDEDKNSSPGVYDNELQMLDGQNLQQTPEENVNDFQQNDNYINNSENQQNENSQQNSENEEDLNNEEENKNV